MGFKAITINTAAEDAAHILAEDDAGLYSGLLGGDCVLNIGSKLAATIVSNNLVRLSDGLLVNGGHFGRIPYGEYEDVAVENGTTGYNRNDLIVARLSTSGGIDTFEIDIVKGTATSGTAADPALTTGNLWQEAALREMALFRVKIAGLSITAVEQMFSLEPSINDMVNASTTEHIVGKWINGKPLYEKTISCGVMPNATTKNVAHGIANMGICMIAAENSYMTDGTTYLPLPSVTVNTTFVTEVAVNATNITIMTAQNRSSYSGYVTLRYTKTTD
ncbi:hypothetical protein [Parasporobacterium paucivorans]|uniref:Uncharacterized protein n=1 Tax=Parasporobacterium paucivorans DSM 15970 TaxID=1122934 RepID=A0A1M6B0X4_9FIRM|nr:hypothetical protein [Parasporobacterium paucivorans]SHI42370.1 hypothetical protein SAMN02745691_00231 [Parasporobacterium paucivorans DSM 15970]